jgi:S-disulfanyl-L-cysteine oxidoreductase SoxD
MTRVFEKRIFTFCFVFILGGFSSSALRGQADSAPGDGLYTVGQAQRGGTAYQKQCAVCHGSELDGVGPYPPLSEGEFLSKYEDQPVFVLFDKINTTMPADHPGLLTRPQTADILSFILSFNKFPAGKTELPSDEESLKKLPLQKPAPKS